MRPLNFLHLTTFYPPYSFGGDAMYIHRLSHALGDAGHNVDVIHCVDSYHLLHPAEPSLKFATHPRVTTHALRSKAGWLSPLLTQQTGRAHLKRRSILEVMRSKPYDVIHYHNISLLGPEVLTLEPLSPQHVKLYMTHEHWLICPTHVLWKFGERPCERPACLQCTLRARRPPQLWRYTDQLANASRAIDTFVSPSRFTARMHADRGFARRVEHLPYFIERVDHEWQNPKPPPSDKPFFLFVGRLEEIKGVQTLIDLWKRVTDCDLLIAGTGDYEQHLKARAADNPRIKFLGALTQSDLGNLYYHALSVIVPSLTFETFGIIIIEAFARKTPVIVRDLGALPEVVADSGGGYVYRNDDELLDAIHKIVIAPELRRELGQQGYNAFLRNWSKQAHLDLYFDFLQKAATRKLGCVPWQEDERIRDAIHTEPREKLKIECSV